MALCNQPLDYLFESVTGLLLASALPLLYKFISSHQQLKKEKADVFVKRKWTYRLGLLFSVINILTLSDFLITLILNPCDDFTKYVILITIFLRLYHLQTYCLLLLSVFRIYWVFKGTALRFTKYTNVFYIISFIALILCLIISSVAPFTIIDIIMTIIQFTLEIFLGICTLVIFIRKLIRVQRTYTSQTDDNDELIRIVTQLSVTTIPSILITITAPIANFLLAGTDYLWIMYFIALADISSNFWCMMLSFKAMNNYYRICCGCIDNQCRKSWKKRVMLTDTVKQESDVTSDA